MHKEVLDWEEYQEVGENGRQGRKLKKLTKKNRLGSWGTQSSPSHLWECSPAQRQYKTHEEKTCLTRE